MKAAQPRIGANVAANVLNAGTTIAVAVLSIPLILSHLGLAGFGVWTLAQTALVYIATAETGFGPAVQRYVSVAMGAGDRENAARVVWSACAFYVGLGALIGIVVAFLAPAFADAFNVPAALRADAITTFRITGAVMLLALLAAGLANVLQGVERFAGAAVATAVAGVVFLVWAFVALESGRGLVGLAEAACAQYVVGVLVRVWLVRDVLAAAPLRWLSRSQGREMLTFSAAMQVNVLSVLINSQTDKLVVGLIATTAAIGEVGVASQAAEAGRLLAGAALGPIVARLAIVHGSGDPEALVRLFRAVNARWIRLTAGMTVIAAASMSPLIGAWLGGEAGRAALYAVLLTVAYGVNVLPGPGFSYLRAIGRPGLEARYGGVVIGLNLTLTVALGLLFGPLGVVAATCAAYSGATAWVWVRLRHAVPGWEREPGGSRLALVAILAAGVALAVGELAVDALPRLLALVVAAAATAGAFVAFAVAVLGAATVRGMVRR